MEQSNFEVNLVEIFRSIHIKINSSLNNFYEPYGVTAVQATVIVELKKSGAQKISDLSKQLNMTNSNISAICQRLEKNGFVERIRDTEDQRVVMACLTLKGDAISQQMMSNVCVSLIPLLKNATEQDQEVILAGLYRLDCLLPVSE